MNTLSDRQIRLALLCGALLLLATLLVGLAVHQHAHFEKSGLDFDTSPGFYPLFGFGGALLLILTAKTLAIALKRKDTYYADD